MQTMDMALERLARAGTIAPEAGLEKALDKTTFAQRLGLSPSGAKAELPGH
jgi:hypothetical protein